MVYMHSVLTLGIHYRGLRVGIDHDNFVSNGGMDGRTVEIFSRGVIYYRGMFLEGRDMS